MLEDHAVDAFLNNISKESDLYLPFMAMLRAQGYQKVHLLAGHYEYGKDVIAQKVDENGAIIQFVFPIKKGNLDQEKWGKLRDQLYECIDNSNAHSDFDSTAPRQVVVVFPGTTVGKVGGLVQEFNKNNSAKLGIPPVILWGNERLKELFRSEQCLSQLDWAAIGKFIEDVSDGAGLEQIEQRTQAWCNGVQSKENLWTRAVELAFLWSFLRKRNLRLHATQLTLCLLRASVCAEFEQKLTQQDSLEFIDFVIKALHGDAKEVLDWFAALPVQHRRESLVRVNGTELVEFSVRTLLILQLISICVINRSFSGEEAKIAKDLLETCLEIPAVAKPISDSFAPAVMAIAAAAASLELKVEPWLRRIAIWICDSYEDASPGLAPAGSDVQEEIWRTCGAPIEYASYPRLSKSMLASAVLDLCSLFSFVDLYNDAAADFRTTDVIASRMIPETAPGEFFTGSKSCFLPGNNDYFDSWQGKEGWVNSSSHLKAYEQRFFNDGARDWIGVALGVLLRDRWWLHSVKVCSQVTL